MSICGNSFNGLVMKCDVDNGWLKDCSTEGLAEWLSVCMNEWRNEWMDEWMWLIESADSYKQANTAHCQGGWVVDCVVVICINCCCCWFQFSSWLATFCLTLLYPLLFGCLFLCLFLHQLVAWAATATATATATAISIMIMRCVINVMSGLLTGTKELLMLLEKSLWMKSQLPIDTHTHAYYLHTYTYVL